MIWIKRILLAVILGLIVIFVGAFIILKTLDVDKFKDKIVQEISKEIKRDVSIRSSKFSFSIGEGVTLQISGLTVMDDPHFSPTAFFYVDSARLNVAFLPLISDRQILVSTVEFDSPTVRLIRNSAGQFNFDSMVKKESQASEATKPKANSNKTSQSQSKIEQSSVNDILIRSIRISDGSFLLMDAMTTPATNIELKQMTIQISNLSDEQAFPVQLSASLWSQTKNIELSSLVQFKAKDKQVRVDNLRLNTDLSSIDLKLVSKNIPSMNNAGLSGAVGGQFTLDIGQMIVTEQGLEVLSSEVRLSNGSADIKDIPVPIKNVSAMLKVSETDLRIEEFILPIASGNITASGQVLEYLSEQNFIGNLDISNIQLKELTANMDLPAKIEGSLNGSFKGNGKGLNQNALEASLAGESKLNVEGGRIVDVNVLRLVLSKLSFIPNLVSKIEENLPQRYKDKLRNNHTVLEQVEMDMRVRNKTVVINQAVVSADGFQVIANGNMDFDQNLTLDAKLIIPEDLSGSMIAAAEDLKLLLNDRRQIQIPFKQYRGKLEQFRMVPNVEDLGLSVIRNKGKDELRKVLFKALDLEEQPTKQPKEGAPAEPSEKKVSPEEAIIENILNSIPIFE